ncbi:MAG: carbonic anhydrase [Betaproteobacteria bacterium]|jgi:carbonic anhydrase|nr:carbonic anhydrase [Betaproteobacteria bacterium]NBR98438.1 carbonic anhydrase [Betaproteobacteria bacterium]NBS92888.1 carbonic anhydrase [Betaproteobacteria bacterium]NBT06282.1 carbonic anhydrase [Betaproteobacteria bacterium]NBU12083.1 carbonic anhydrase [Betaproteobacteria bacterium]
MIPATEALERLKAGNERFVSNVRSVEAMAGRSNRSELVASQTPFAIILGCSDSRVPAELVFDQGLGDLFVIRVAGNIVAPSQIGSVEFAAEKLGSRLVVVMGHTNCGAVEATIEAVLQGEANDSRNIRSIIERVRCAVDISRESAPGQDKATLMQHATRANVRISANQLRHGSDIIERLIDKDGLMVVGAEYSLETGRVEFLDGA